MSIDIKKFLENTKVFSASTDDHDLDSKIAALIDASVACGKWIVDRDGSCENVFDVRNHAHKDLVDLIRARLNHEPESTPSP